MRTNQRISNIVQIRRKEGLSAYAALLNAEQDKNSRTGHKLISKKRIKRASGRHKDSFIFLLRMPGYRRVRGGCVQAAFTAVGLALLTWMPLTRFWIAAAFSRGL